MANDLSSIVSKPRSRGEIIAGGFADALKPSDIMGKVVTQDIATDQWTISPYRKYLARLVGGKTSKFVAKMDELEQEMQDQKETLINAKKSQTGEVTTTKTIKGAEDLKRYATITADKPLTKENKLLIQMAGGDISKLKGKVPVGSTLGGITKNSGGDPKKLNQLVARIKGEGIKISDKTLPSGDAKNEAENKYTTARDKYNKMVKQFNQKIPKKSELEKMTGLSMQQAQNLYRRYRGGGSGNSREYYRKKALFDELMKTLEKLNDEKGTLKLKYEDPQSGETIPLNKTLGNIINRLKTKGANILRDDISFNQAIQISDPINKAIGSLQQIKEGKDNRSLLKRAKDWAVAEFTFKDQPKSELYSSIGDKEILNILGLEKPKTKKEKLKQ